MSGARITQEQYDEYARRGLVRADTLRSVRLPDLTPESDQPEGKVVLLPSFFMEPATWVIGCKTISVSNDRRHHAKLTGMKQSQRRAVAKLLGRHLRELVPFADAYHSGKVLNVTLTRLAPRQMDRSNVSVSLKYIEDTVADFLGADDGANNWQIECKQEKSERYGVRLELEIEACK